MASTNNNSSHRGRSRARAKASFQVKSPTKGGRGGPQRGTRRNSKQRNTLFECFQEAQQPMRPDQLLVCCKKNNPGIGIATIYRNLRLLLAERKIVEVQLPNQPTRYSLARPVHQHHFYCRKCRGLFVINRCVAGLRQLLDQGFVLEDHHITLYGVCAHCAA